MIKLEDERELRLMVFGAALLAIAVREKVLCREPAELDKVLGIRSECIDRSALAEARAVADAVIAEARRLQAEGTPP